MANPFNRSGVSRKDAKAMGDMLSGGKNAHSSRYSRVVLESEKERFFSTRALTAFLLLIILPPVGIALLWRKKIFLTRGRILLTAVSTLILMAMLIPLMPEGGMQTVTPSPNLPTSFTYSKGNAVQADFDRLSQTTGQNNSYFSSVVYTTDGDEYYHTSALCDGNPLTLALTIEQAHQRELTACPVCNPPA